MGSRSPISPNAGDRWQSKGSFLIGLAHFCLGGGCAMGVCGVVIWTRPLLTYLGVQWERRVIISGERPLTPPLLPRWASCQNTQDSLLAFLCSALTGSCLLQSGHKFFRKATPFCFHPTHFLHWLGQQASGFPPPHAQRSLINSSRASVLLLALSTMAASLMYPLLQ